MRPRVPVPTGTEIRVTGVGRDQVAFQTVGGTERDAAHDAVAQLLLDFEGDFGVLDLQRVIHFGHFVAVELDVHHRADDLYNLALAHFGILKKSNL